MKAQALRELTETLVANIAGARKVQRPFFHLEFDRVFPDEIYAAMLHHMPSSDDYRPLPGRGGGNLRADGSSTRVKIDLFPEYIRHFPIEAQGVWRLVGRALCSDEVRRAFMTHLAPGLERRFQAGYSGIDMYPIPVLTRDIPGYSIAPHPDTHWKGITVQLYLPADDKNTHIGTIFHDRLPDGSISKAAQMKFVPNSGYAFAVGDNTWHSADPVGAEVTTRDSILLTYFVDSGLLRLLRNRGKRIGNFLLNEAKHLRRLSRPA